MTYCAIFASLLAVCAWLSIPMGSIAVTLQTFGIFLSLLLLGGKWGTLSILLYLLMGVIGLPVFSGFQGGFGTLLGITGGFLRGFAVLGLLFCKLERFGKIPALIAGLLACYGCGCLWFYAYSGGGFGFILLQCVVPYLIPDAVKLWLAVTLSRRLSKVINFPSRT
jgi:biotin transport system substrate-specific component